MDSDKFSDIFVSSVAYISDNFVGNICLISPQNFKERSPFQGVPWFFSRTPPRAFF